MIVLLDFICMDSSNCEERQVNIYYKIFFNKLEPTPVKAKSYSQLLEQWYLKERLKSSLKKIYGRYGDLIKQYEVPLSQMLNDIL